MPKTKRKHATQLGGGADRAAGPDSEQALLAPILKATQELCALFSELSVSGKKRKDLLKVLNKRRRDGDRFLCISKKDDGEEYAMGQGKTDPTPLWKLSVDFGVSSDPAPATAPPTSSKRSGR